MREQLRELLVHRAERVDLAEPALDVGGVVGRVGAALPRVRAVVGPEEGGQLLADVDPLLAEVDALLQRLLDLVVVGAPEVHARHLGLDEARRGVRDDVHQVDHAVLRVHPVVQLPEVVEGVVTGLENVLGL